MMPVNLYGTVNAPEISVSMTRVTLPLAGAAIAILPFSNSTGFPRAVVKNRCPAL